MTLLRSVVFAVSLGAALGLHGTSADAGSKGSQSGPSPFMRVFQPTSGPIGYVEHCNRYGEDCRADGRGEARLTLTAERLSEVDRINRAINREIAPVTDRDLYGVEEYWTYPDERMKGDCEDYVLLKRRVLMQRGWPASSLLITVVRDERLEGHAILTLRTLQGDFVLDNKNDEIRPWHRTTYEYVMRQSYLNPRLWLSLEPNEADASVAVAGVRARR